MRTTCTQPAISSSRRRRRRALTGVLALLVAALGATAASAPLAAAACDGPCKSKATTPPTKKSLTKKPAPLPAKSLPPETKKPAPPPLKTSPPPKTKNSVSPVKKPAPPAVASARPEAAGDDGTTLCESDWMTQASAEGVGYGFSTSIWPSWRARRLATIPAWLWPDDAFPDFLRPMWDDLKRCLKFSSNRNFGLNSIEMTSLKKQLACHAYHGIVGLPFLGGNSWDLEARRTMPSWSEVYDIRKRCSGYIVLAPG